MHWRTLEKMLQHSEPPGYRQAKARPKPKMGAYVERIEQILREDEGMPRKQRHTAKRVWERLREEGYTGGYTAIKDAVRELKARRQEVFVPLQHRPGEAQVDFGQALVKVGGVLQKVSFFVLALPYSDCFYVQAFERECTETFGKGIFRRSSFWAACPGGSVMTTRASLSRSFWAGRNGS